MKKLILAAAILVMGGCAVPVRPVAKLVPDTDGSMHFIADAAQEPHVDPQVLTGISGVLSMLGPWGQVGAALVATAGAAAAGHAHGKRKKKPKKDATVPATAAAVIA